MTRRYLASCVLQVTTETDSLVRGSLTLPRRRCQML